MKIKSRIIYFIFIIAFNSYGQEIFGYYYGTINPFIDEIDKYVSVSDYRFNNNQYYFTTKSGSTKADREIPKKYFIDDTYQETGTYKIVSNGALKKIQFYSNNGYEYKKELGILYNERRVFLFEGNELFFMPDEDLRFENTMPIIVSVKVSSYLVEGKINYDGKNFVPLKQKKLKPWIPSKNKFGIGDWIELSIQITEYFKIIPLTHFLISNGYVDYIKPQLYYDNSRVKRVKIESKKEKISILVDLADTPALQTIRLPNKIESNEEIIFRFTILDVYKGNKYNDTAVNMIFPMGDDPHKQ